MLTPNHHIGEQDELAMIGSVIFEPSRLDMVAAIATPADVFDEELREFYQLLIDLHELGRPINDPVLVNTERIRRELAINAARIAEIFTGVPNAQNAEFYAGNVAERSRLRRLSGVRDDITEGLRNPQAESIDILNRLDSSVKLLGSSRSTIRLVNAEDAANSIESGNQQASMAMTGFVKIDERYGGFSAGELVVIGARLGCGKTSMAWQILLHNAIKGRHCLFVSLEMSVKQMMSRHYASHTSVSAIDIRTGRFSEASIQGEKERFSELPISLFAPPSATVLQIAAAARLKQSGGGLSLLVVDYLGKVKAANSRNEKREQIGQISGDLKTLARELEIPVVAVVQLNREADNARKLKASHLADSDDIGRDADQVFLLDRDRSKGVTKLNIAKHRYVADDTATELYYQDGRFFEEDLTLRAYQ